MVEANIFTAGSDDENAAARAVGGAGPDNNYTAMNFEEAQQSSSSSSANKVIDMKKYKIKSDVFVLGGSLLVNSIPIIADVMAHRNDTTPHKVDKSAIARMGIAALTPAVKLIDDAFLGGKIQEKTHGILDDIGNVVNIVCAYPAVHSYITNMTENSVRSSQGKNQIPISGTIKFQAAMGIVNIATPYVASRLAMPNLTIAQKFSMCLPIPIIGRMISYFGRSNPQFSAVYNTGNVLYNAATGLSHSLKPVVRNNPGSTSNKLMDNIDGALSLFGDMTGMSRRGLGYGYSGNGYIGNSYDNYSRYNGYNRSSWGGSF